MFYTTEEAAIVCGFLNLYLDRASVDANLRKRRTIDGRRMFSAF